MKNIRLFLCFLLAFSSITAIGQKKWDFDLGLGASLNTGNVNNCNVKNTIAVNRNDSLISMDVNYKLLYSSLIDKKDTGRKWEETNFEVNCGAKLDYKQYGKYSPFLACEFFTNKYKGYNYKVSGLIGLKYRIYTKPSVCDYSISAAFVDDHSVYTDETVLPTNNYRISIRPKIKQKLSDNLYLVHFTFYQPSVLDFKDYLIDSETKLQTQITKMLHLDLSFIYEYRSRVPADSYKKHDIHTEVTFRLKI